MKQLIKFLSILIPIGIFSQIRVDDVGDGWKQNVNKAILKIKEVDSTKYKILVTYCDHIGYWGGKYSTTEGRTILLSTSDVSRGLINNICAAIVHESMHLMINNSGGTKDLQEWEEEVFCYMYEIDFLESIPSAEPWLIMHARKMIEYYGQK